MTGRGSRIAVSVLALLAEAACTFNPGTTLFVMRPGSVPEGPAVTERNIEAVYADGRFLDIERFVRSLSPDRVEKDRRLLRYLGSSLLARGDADAARPYLERALRLEARPQEQAAIEWILAQDYIYVNDFGAARDYAEAAVRHGRGLVPGFLRFLEAASGIVAYRGVPVGTRGATPFQIGSPNLIRFPTAVNDVQTSAVLDTGASYAILTRSLAERAGVRPIPGSNAFGRGLHEKEIPLTFAIVDRLDFADLTLRNVPVVIIADDDLYFDTPEGQFRIPMVLGFHLLKEFSLDIDYGRRRLGFARIDPRVPKQDSEQNLFVVRGKLFVRGALDLSGWYPFLLDTGSEPTMLTTAGLKRAGIPQPGSYYPMRVQGIGKSRVEWTKMKNVAIGIGRYIVRFDDVVVNDDDNATETGIVGYSFLGNFRVRIDLARMIVQLDPIVPVTRLPYEAPSSGRIRINGVDYERE
jgi:predicted aspartyl protease